MTPDGRLDEVLAWAQPSEPAQRLDEADHPVAAHPEDEGPVEEDHAGCAPLVDRLGEQRGDHRLVAPRLVHQFGGQAPIPSCKVDGALAERLPAELRETVDHDSRRFAAGVRVDDVNRRQVDAGERVAHSEPRGREAVDGDVRSLAVDDLADDPTGSRSQRETGHRMAGGDRDISPAR